MIAVHVVDHRQPFAAPIAAVMSLNAARGERGSNAVRLLLGVILGILVGEAAIAVNGSLDAATLVAMFVDSRRRNRLGGPSRQGGRS